jgi:pimeloyl-ACP methyl ester carboxylesterase
MTPIRVTALAGLLVLLGAATTAYLYHRAIDQARTRIAEGSHLAQTSCGPIEYGVAGDGPPVLTIHGAGGGWDQGLDFSLPLIERGFRVIAMSRFGYLRTPLPPDASPAAQADAHACLMDALAIRQVAVIGGSAGAPSALQFALRHPQRITALILLVPALYVPRPGGAPAVHSSSETQFMVQAVLHSDFLAWAGSRLAPDAFIRSLLATPPDVVRDAAESEQARVRSVLDHLLPISERRLGLMNEAAVIPSLPRYELERVAVPTLAISCADDLFGTYEAARYTADHIPGARFVGYQTGGHLWVGHQDDVLREIAMFLEPQAARSTNRAAAGPARRSNDAAPAVQEPERAR